ncbi:PilN domain-containing protein [Sulfuriferula sp. GW1]|uniref:PilN domain-containing protein n=1 Tax=Sulfuriferula sp. GW1 TaxID=3345111 RepID=UPI0039AF7CC5
MGLPALALDFKRTPRPWAWLGVVLLVIGAAWLVQVVNSERALSGQIDLATARQQVMARHSKIKVAAPPLDAEALQQQIRQANAILQQLALPWDALFQTLEATRDQDIALLSIQPDAAKQSVRIGGEAKNLTTLLAYITRLEQGRVLDHVYLTSHEVRTQDAEQPVRFSLAAHWAVQP